MGSDIFLKFNKWGERGEVKINGGSQNFKKSVNIGNKSKKRHKHLILMLKLKVSKQIRSEASKNKVSNSQKNIKHINKLSKYK